jgi:valyl-tRNA synthetase
MGMMDENNYFILSRIIERLTIELPPMLLVLHMGHMLNNTIQDVLIRKRV